ncbi:DUF4129 domain-containing protein [Bacillus sp. Bva_UNVM-123]|uniref:DUF4129 domain-containing transglutaminase family protein n=1 Tax=Bacillus sp. Bva_UNVM-123 TaxID=2829798 RepID=UPI00391EFA31
MRARKVQRDFATFLLYVFGFLLLWEWLRPVEQLTDTANLFIFLLFIIVSFLLAYVGAPVILSVFIKCLFIVYALRYLYFEEPFFQFDWFKALIADTLENFTFVIERDWESLSNIFRSLLFFVLLWLMTYLLQYWLIARRQLFIFFFMTLVYITVLDTFTAYDAGFAIIRTIVLGFMVMGMLTFYRLLDREAIVKTGLSRKWMAPLMILIALSVGIGFIAPKAEPIWPDPVPYLKSYGKEGRGGSGGIQKLGYGMDDSRLGGPFIPDNQVVFSAEVESRHYWKVETKDVYTGKGWISSFSREERTSFELEDEVPIVSFSNSDAIEKKLETGTITTFLNYPHIVYPLGIQKILVPPTVSFELEDATEKIRTVENGNPVSLKQYALQFEVPKYSITALKEATSDENSLNQQFMERYTQLPGSLPQRIQDLALEITAEKGTVYDKVKELERYFNQTGYMYDQTNVAVPEPEDDYVEQFLFETKRGYCDNFSTSMVVMARSIGIPARWVKGYTEGEYKRLGNFGNSIYEITNNNAHSWVEVYFPGIGWVPFEPTKGFTSNVLFNYDVTSDDALQAPVVEQKNNDSTKPELDEGKSEKSSSSSFSFKKIIASVKEFFVKSWKKLVIIVLIIAAMLFFMYRVRGKWLPHYLAWRFRWTKKDENFPKAYLLLLRELERFGLPRQEGQTLRDYADYVDQFFRTKKMRQLTSRYEELIYRGELEQGSWEETKELWENLIKKTIA